MSRDAYWKLIIYVEHYIRLAAHTHSVLVLHLVQGSLLKIKNAHRRTEGLGNG